jgi:sec-independent protein translocase protein TatA
MGPIGLPELVVILVVVMLIFGAKKIPEIARSLGSAVNEFKKGISPGGRTADAESGRKDDGD